MDDMDVDDVNESYSELPQDEEEEEKAEVREEYRKLNEEICRQEDGILDSINLTQLIHKNDKLYEKVRIISGGRALRPYVQTLNMCNVCGLCIIFIGVGWDGGPRNVL